ncbi:metal ABC transporter ATP-binding protein [Acetanaerobacterium elongatum]|uniref:Zinc transport system ATP-binding protein n=1 Tax=Acetanaerobacterium elongatum TaxID=258515 RepID=A0A1H0FY56_9FIRM|nr:ATP-binding cassette domain-containing protein [Acetanaerobacterium elongatum]SDN99494.1 zinc transport system ATP-binding protein [Acetanaerobacterium elongatum]
MSNIIEVDKLTFGYTAEPILYDIGFSVRQGDFAAIIGSNGTGKSTLLKLLLGELIPKIGSIRLLDEDIRHFKGWSQIGYVPQNAVQTAAGFPATAEEIVSANLYAQVGLLCPIRKKHMEQARQALALVGMQDYAKSMIGNLSGGQQQRVMLARVLVNSPKLMLLDEPTTGVDASAAQSLYELLAKLNREKGLTIVMVTHDIVHASGYVSRTLCLEQGSVVELDRVQIAHELSHKHKHPQHNELTADGQGESKFER